MIVDLGIIIPHLSNLLPSCEESEVLHAGGRYLARQFQLYGTLGSLVIKMCRLIVYCQSTSSKLTTGHGSFLLREPETSDKRYW